MKSNLYIVFLGLLQVSLMVSCGTDASSSKKPSTNRENADATKMDQVVTTFSDASGKTNTGFSFDCSSSCNVSVKVNVTGITYSDLIVTVKDGPQGAVVQDDLTEKEFVWTSPSNVSAQQVTLLIRNFASCIAINNDEEKCKSNSSASATSASAASNVNSAYDTTAAFALTVIGVKATTATASTSGSSSGTSNSGTGSQDMLGTLGGLLGGGNSSGGLQSIINTVQGFLGGGTTNTNTSTNTNN